MTRTRMQSAGQFLIGCRSQSRSRSRQSQDEEELRTQLVSEKKNCEEDGCLVPGPATSEVVVGQSGITHDAPLGSGLQVSVAVNWYDGKPPRSRVSVDVVAPVGPRQCPAALL